MGIRARVSGAVIMDYQEHAVRTFWAGPASQKEYRDSTDDEERGFRQTLRFPEGVVALPLPAGQLPYPVTCGQWFLRVIAYRATEAGSDPDAAFILISDQALDANDRPLYLAYVNGGKTSGVVKPVGAGARYYRLRPAPGDAITFKLIPAQPASTPPPTAPKFQIGVELSLRAPKLGLFGTPLTR